MITVTLDKEKKKKNRVEIAQVYHVHEDTTVVACSLPRKALKNTTPNLIL